MSRTYAVKEAFVTLQGEGARAGEKAAFLRLAGCNLWNGRPEDRARGTGPCALWCDTDFFKGEKLTAEQVLAKLNELWPYALPSKDEGRVDYWRRVVVTGGEPALQWDEELRTVLLEDGWSVAMESNGTVPIAAAVDWLCVSPKRGTELAEGVRPNEVKVVLPGDSSGGWTDDELRALARRFPHARLYVQPQDVVATETVERTLLKKNHPGYATGDGTLALMSAHAEHVRRCVDFCMANPRWRLSWQLHKSVGLP